MREQFEKLPKIAEMLKRKDIYYGDYYGGKTYMIGSEPHGYLNGALYAYQEQQKVINGMLECMDDAIRLIDEGNSWDAKELLK